MIPELNESLAEKQSSAVSQEKGRERMGLMVEDKIETLENHTNQFSYHESSRHMGTPIRD